MKPHALLGGFLILVVVANTARTEAQNAPLQASTKHTRNPERGFINQDHIYPRRQGETQSMTRFLLDLSAKCNSTDIAAEAKAFEIILKKFRAAHKQLIVRIVYSDREGMGNGCGTGHRFEPANFAVLSEHLAQLRPIIHANARSIAAWEAGILGAFGEWHGWGQERVNATTYVLYDEGHILQAGVGAWGNVPEAGRDGRLTVLRLLLDTVPPPIPVLVRRPVFRFEATRRYIDAGRHFVNHLSGQRDALTAAEVARIGFHNDCFLSSADDYSTYSADFGAKYYPEIDTTEEARAYVAGLADRVPFGGEICWPQASATLSCPDTLQTMAEMGVTYLNRNWYDGAIDGWLTGGCFGEIERRIGYRFVVRRVGTATVVSPRQPMTVSLNVDNVGFGRLLQPRQAEFVMVRRRRALRAGIELAVTSSAGLDAQRWLAGATSTVAQTFEAPDTPGQYRLHIAIPAADRVPM
ncbi:MAG: DUF4832 domain-containing protein, partial [Myxococcota bacterium]